MLATTTFWGLMVWPWIFLIWVLARSSATRGLRRRLLCRLGWHRWVLLDAVVGVDHVECERCSVRKLFYTGGPNG